MKKIIAVACAIALLAVGRVAFASESIVNFLSEIQVNADNSVDITETIVYDTGGADRHGIYRDIRPYSSENRYMNISDIIVTDEHLRPYQWEQQTSNGSVRLKIGDSNTTFRGQRTYRIAYNASDAVGHPADVDEIYWNVTGNGWEMPILHAQARLVYLPPGLKVLQSACYFGAMGSINSCGKAGEIVDIYEFPRPLKPQEGMSVAFGFEKGVIPEYTAESKDPSIFKENVLWILSLLLVLATGTVMYRTWSKYGRDPKGRGTIIPEYEVPADLTPLEVKALVTQKIKPEDISAEIIYLATLGYIKIRQTETKVLIFKSTDYEFTLLKEYSDITNEFDRSILSRLFEKGVGTQTLVSSLKIDFYKTTKLVLAHLVASLKNKGYYTTLRSYNLAGTRAIIIPGMIAAVWLTGSLGIIVASTLSVSPLPVFIGAALSAFIVLVFVALMPARTEKGVLTREYLLGFKEYLQIAEKDRLAFHNAPEKRPEIFEKFLPFAMVFGVDKVWAKEFGDMYTTPPSWYEGQYHGVFSAVALQDSLRGFNTFAASSFAPSGNVHGGSGGGGFSGGGGGGGGGGSW